MRLKIERASEQLDRKTFRLEIARRIAACTVGLQRIYKESKIGPCGGFDPLQNGKKKTCAERRSR
jgi:hypothetical protein